MDGKEPFGGGALHAGALNAGCSIAMRLYHERLHDMEEAT
jgi:hypothetical protein